MVTDPLNERPGVDPKGALAEVSRDPGSRKQFLKMMGGGAAGAGALSLLVAACGGNSTATGGATGAASTSPTSSGNTTGDLAIVNYALTLEYIEADFYAAVISSGLFHGAQLDLIKVIGDHEQQHVAALESTAKQLGTPAAKPKTTFPLKDAKSVLGLAATVENLGASAYLGQAGMIKSTDILAAALAIHSVEARHAAALNVLTGKSPTPTGAFAAPASMAQVLPQVKPFIVT